MSAIRWGLGMNEQTLNVFQLRKVLDSIYDGENKTFHYIMRIQSFYVKKKNKSREQQVYMWFIRNKITGKKFVEFFEQYGFLEVMNHVVNRLDGRKFSNTNIKINECY